MCIHVCVWLERVHVCVCGFYGSYLPGYPRAITEMRVSANGGSTADNAVDSDEFSLRNVIAAFPSFYRPRINHAFTSISYRNIRVSRYAALNAESSEYR